MARKPGRTPQHVRADHQDATNDRTCPAAPNLCDQSVVIERNHLAVDDAVGKVARCLPDCGKFVRQVQALAREHLGFAAFHPQLHTVAVELDLMDPVLPRWRAPDALAELR